MHATGTLARNIFLKSIASIGIVAFFALLINSYLIIDTQKKERIRSIESTIKLITPNLANAAWQISSSSVELLLQSIYAIDGVVSATYTDSHIEVVAGDRITLPSACTHLFKKNIDQLQSKGGKSDNGTLVICYRHEDWWQTWMAESWQALFPMGMLLVAAVYPGWLIRRKVLRPLERLTSSLSSAEPLAQVTHPNINRQDDDEFSRLVKEINARTTRLINEQGLIELVFSALKDGIVISDHDGIVLRVNPFAQTLPLDFELAVGVPIDHRIREASELNVPQRLEVSSKNGRVIEVTWSKVFTSDGGKFRAYLLRDITSRYQDEQLVRQAQKVSALGTLASGVAHDFNNLLMTISGNAELVLQEERISEDGQKMVANIKHAARRGAKLTAQLMSIARKQPLKPQLLSAKEICDQVIEMSKRTLGSTHKLTANGGAKSFITADPTYLETALLNLIINARDAQPSGGTIELRISPAIRLKSTYICFSVINAGPAIPDEVRARMGEPFFTTKEHGRGTGLGLSMVFAFAKQSDGHCEIASIPGRTEISILLPAVDTQEILITTEKNPVDEQTQSRPISILVVDDDPLVLETLYKICVMLGNHVSKASSLTDVDSLISAGAQWDLVVTDVVLEGCSGLDVIDIIRKSGRNPRVIYLSGNVPHTLLPMLEKSDHIALISKPVGIRKLSEIISTAFKHESYPADGRPE